MPEVTFYVQFVESKNTSGRVVGVRAQKMTSMKPSGAGLEGVVVKFSVEVPYEVFKPLEATPMTIEPRQDVIESAQAGTLRIARELSQGDDGSAA